MSHTIKHLSFSDAEDGKYHRKAPFVSIATAVQEEGALTAKNETLNYLACSAVAQRVRVADRRLFDILCAPSRALTCWGTQRFM